jgi:hypothetical protein
MFQVHRLEAVEKQKEAEMLLAKAKKEQVLARLSGTTAGRVQVEASLEAQKVEIPAREPDARVQIMDEHRQDAGESYKAKLNRDREKLFSSGLTLSDDPEVTGSKDSEVVEKARLILNRPHYGTRTYLEGELKFKREQKSVRFPTGKRVAHNFYSFQGKKVVID